MWAHIHPHTPTPSHPHRLLGGRKKKSPLRKTSSASGKKLIECALQEITETRETGSEECLFERECVDYMYVYVGTVCMWTRVSVCGCVCGHV